MTCERVRSRPEVKRENNLAVSTYNQTPRCFEEADVELVAIAARTSGLDQLTKAAGMFHP